MGIEFANAWGSIMYASHVYNATQQEKLLIKIWKDMELLITLQGTEKLFIGDPPKDVEGYLKRYLLSMGYSATVLASNRRRNAPTASASGPRGLSELCAAGALFKGRYCRNDLTVSWTTDSIEPIMEAKMEDDSDDENAKKRPRNFKTSASGSLIRRPTRISGSIPTVDFLQDLANALHAETLELSIDYLRLHRSCWMLLHSVNEACKPRLLEIYGAGYLEREYQLPSVIGYIFMAATRTSEVANMLLPRRDNVQVSSRLLATAAGALKSMIESGTGGIECKFIEERLGDVELEFGELDDPEEHD